LPSLLDVSPAPLVIVAIAVAMVAMIMREWETLTEWAKIPIWWWVFRILPRWRIVLFFTSRITPLRLSHLSIIGYTVIAFLSLTFLATGGQPSWLDDLVVLILLALQALFIAWTIYLACIRIEPIIPPKELPVE